MRFSPGDEVGRYIIESLLGEGGMGEVYRASDPRLERKVALKVLRKSAEETSETWGRAVTRMLREARAVAALSHPGIVAIYDVGENDDTPFIAMELIQGKPLRALVASSETMNARLRIILDIAKALAAAHHAGLIHRDIKPENVIIRPDGVVKILDFGIARRAGSSAADPMSSTIDKALATVTADGAIVGTPAYMAPEQLRGEAIDARADQFAWGVLAHELLTKQHPFKTAKGAVGLIASILSDPPAPLPDAPPEVAAIILRTLEKSADSRFASMDDVIAALSAFVTGETLQAPPPSLPSLPGQALTAPSGEAMFTPKSDRRRRGGWRRWLVAPPIAAAAAVCVVALHGRGVAPQSAPDLTATPLPTVAGPAPTAVTDLPTPRTDSAEARAAFREGIQAIRDAGWNGAAAAFDRARKADPELAAAHLRFAIIEASFDTTASREAIRKTLSLRTSLDERDQGMLDVMAPLIQEDPPDYPTIIRKLDALSSKYPGDAEILFWMARLITHSSTKEPDIERAVGLLNRCVELDPFYADCWQTKELALRLLGREEEALVALNKCIEVSTSAVDCLQDKIFIDSGLGRCNAVMDTARKWMGKEPAAPAPYVALGSALYAMNAPEAAVTAALTQAEKRFREGGRLFEAAEAHAAIALRFGDFDAALRETDAIASTLTAPKPGFEVGLAWLRADLRLELGKVAEATEIAEEFRAKSAVRPVTAPNDGFDPTLVMHAILVRAGKSTPAAYEAERSDWLAKQPLDSAVSREHAWLSSYVFPALTREMAEQGLAEGKKLAPLPPGDPAKLDANLAASYGKLLFLSGKMAEAAPLLERGITICGQVGLGLYWSQTMGRLGIAREGAGDKAGACSAYQTVLARWGRSTSSLTVKEVTKRAKALGCEARRG